MATVKNVILGVCGSIAAYKAGDIIRRLQDKGCDVTVIMTREAEKFISPMTLAALSNNAVYTDMFDESAWRMAHIELTRKAHAVLVAPATANIIAKAAHGFADDILTALLLTVRAPIFLAPAMNDDMYDNSIVQDNCAKLRKCGMNIIEPIKGKLACGVTGVGHLADVDDIVMTVIKN